MTPEDTEKEPEMHFVNNELAVIRSNLKTWNYWGRNWRLARRKRPLDERTKRMMKIRAITYRVAYNEMLNAFQGFRNKRVVDIGCGTSDYLRWLSTDCTQLIGVDISVEMLKLCREEVGRNIELIAADALHLPFRDNTFDISTTFQALHHFPNWAKALNEMIRTANAVSLYEPNKDSFFHRLMHEVRKTFRVEQRFQEVDEDYLLVEFEASGFHKTIIADFLQKGGVATEVFTFGLIPVSILEKISRVSMFLYFTLIVEDLLRKIPLIKNQLGGILVIGQKRNDECKSA